MVWLGLRIADLKKWLLYNIESRTFEVSQCVKEFPKRATTEVRQVFTTSKDQDSLMTGFDDEGDESFDLPDSPLRQGLIGDFTRSDLQLPLSTNDAKDFTWKGNSLKPSPVAPTKILTKADVKMAESASGKHEIGSSPPERQVNTDSEEWLKTRGVTLNPLERKEQGDYYSSDSLKVDILNPLDGDANDPTKV